MRYANMETEPVNAQKLKWTSHLSLGKWENKYISQNVGVFLEIHSDMPRVNSKLVQSGPYTVYLRLNNLLFSNNKSWIKAILWIDHTVWFI